MLADDFFFLFLGGGGGGVEGGGGGSSAVGVLQSTSCIIGRTECREATDDTCRGQKPDVLSNTIIPERQTTWPSG